jgi:hypothetical protein
LCASVAADLFRCRMSLKPNPGSHMFQFFSKTNWKKFFF